MAVHTYQVNPLSVIQQTSSDVLWRCTGLVVDLQVDFDVQFWQSAVAGMTVAQIKTFVKGLVDTQTAPLATPSGTLAAFSGATFTQ